MTHHWLTIATGITLLAGCAPTYYPIYPNYIPNDRSFPTSTDIPSWPYAIQPTAQMPWPASTRVVPMPEFQQEPAPIPQIPVVVPEPASGPEPHLVQDPTQSATVPLAVLPDAITPTEAPATSAGSSAIPERQGASTPLQGFRPMRGQTRSGV